MERDPRASLLVAEGGSADPLANGRVTMLGPCTRVGEDGGSARATFLAAHSNSTYFADFRDFAFWKLHVGYVRYIGGYGRMSWISQADWRAAEPDPLGPSAAGLIAHMNAGHADRFGSHRYTCQDSRYEAISATELQQLLSDRNMTIIGSLGRIVT